MQVQLKCFRYAAVVFERFRAGGFGVVGYKRHRPDLESFGGGEKGHVGRVVVEGVDEGSFFQNEVRQSRFLRLDAAGKPDGASSDDDQVKCLHRG